MAGRRREITVYVRNKQRYDPSSKLYDFLHVTVRNFARTTIGAIKEDVIRQTGNNVKINDLFLNNERLADDRSVAHYNIEDGTILETTSNPFWAACIYIKKCEVEQQRAANPDNAAVQHWTYQSSLKKLALLSLLFNSKNEFRSQPPHFPTLEDFVLYLKTLNKKGASMHPEYTQRDLQTMYQDYLQQDVGRSGDPLGNFIRRYAIKLGYRGHENNGNSGTGQQNSNKTSRGRGRNKQSTSGTSTRQNAGSHKSMNCEDCEVALAELYCHDCQNARDGRGLQLCRACSASLHAGATRRGHKVDNVENAPKLTTPYVPHAFKAPFSLLVAMYRALTERPAKLSMTEVEIKERAQPLTDTDLQDKQSGQYCAGFDCMEKLLMMKGLVLKEDSRNPTYALTESGVELAEKLFMFQQAVQKFMMSNRIPGIPQLSSTQHRGRRICLIVDEQERDKERLLKIAQERNVDIQVRQLGAGDYVWIMTPPFSGQGASYTERNHRAEMMLPYIVERKSWEDLRDSVRTKRFYKQINNMLGSGLDHCFYLLEGSIGRMKYKPSEDQQRKLKDNIEKIFVENGFYVNYTASWYKSAIWLLWVTELLNELHRKGKLPELTVSYAEFCRRTIGQSRNTVLHRTDFRRGLSGVWEADQFIDGLFRDSINEISLLEEVVRGVNDQHRNKKKVLIIQGLEAYNKRRQSVLNNCLTLADRRVGATPIPETVKENLEPQLHNMLHYDIMSYWQLRIQVMLQVYVVRTEKAEDTQHVQEEIQGEPPDNPGHATVSTAVGTNSSARQHVRGVRGSNSSTTVSGNIRGSNSSACTSSAIALSEQEALTFRPDPDRPNMSRRVLRSGKSCKPSATITTPTDEDEDDELQRVLQLSLTDATHNETKSTESIPPHDLDINLVRQSRIEKLDHNVCGKQGTKTVGKRTVENHSNIQGTIPRILTVQDSPSPIMEARKDQNSSSHGQRVKESMETSEGHTSTCHDERVRESIEDNQEKDLRCGLDECGLQRYPENSDNDVESMEGSQDLDTYMMINDSQDEDLRVALERSMKEVTKSSATSSRKDNVQTVSPVEVSYAKPVECVETGATEMTTPRNVLNTSTPKTRAHVVRFEETSTKINNGKSETVTTNITTFTPTMDSVTLSFNKDSEGFTSIPADDGQVPSDSQDQELQLALKLSLQDQSSSKIGQDEILDPADPMAPSDHVDPMYCATDPSSASDPVSTSDCATDLQESGSSATLCSNIAAKNSADGGTLVESLEILDSQSQETEEIQRTEARMENCVFNLDCIDGVSENSEKHKEDVITIDSQDSQGTPASEINETDVQLLPFSKSIPSRTMEKSVNAVDESCCLQRSPKTREKSRRNRDPIRSLLLYSSQTESADQDFGNVLVEDSQEINLKGLCSESREESVLYQRNDISDSVDSSVAGASSSESHVIEESLQTANSMCSNVITGRIHSIGNASQKETASQMVKLNQSSFSITLESDTLKHSETPSDDASQNSSSETIVSATPVIDWAGEKVRPDLAESEGNLRSEYSKSKERPEKSEDCVRCVILSPEGCTCSENTDTEMDTNCIPSSQKMCHSSKGTEKPACAITMTNTDANNRNEQNSLSANNFEEKSVSEKVDIIQQVTDVSSVQQTSYANLTKHTTCVPDVSHKQDTTSSTVNATDLKVQRVYSPRLEQSTELVEKEIQQVDSRNTTGTLNESDDVLCISSHQLSEVDDDLPSIDGSQEFTPLSGEDREIISLDDSEELPTIDWMKTKENSAVTIGSGITRDIGSGSGMKTLPSSAVKGMMASGTSGVVKSTEKCKNKLTFSKSSKKDATPEYLTRKNDRMLIRENTTNRKEREEEFMTEDEKIARELQKQFDEEFKNSEKKSPVTSRETRSLKHATSRETRSTDKVDYDADLVITQETIIRPWKHAPTIPDEQSDDVIIDEIQCTVPQQKAHTNITTSDDAELARALQEKINRDVTCTSDKGKDGSRLSKNNSNIDVMASQRGDRRGSGQDSDLELAIAMSMQDLRGNMGDSHSQDRSKGMVRKRHATDSDTIPVPAKVPHGAHLTSGSNMSTTGQSTSGSTTSTTCLSPWYKKLFAADLSNQAKLHSEHQLKTIREERNQQYRKNHQGQGHSFSVHQGQGHSFSVQPGQGCSFSVPSSQLDLDDDLIHLDSEGYLTSGHRGSQAKQTSKTYILSSPSTKPGYEKLCHSSLSSSTWEHTPSKSHWSGIKEGGVTTSSDWQVGKEGRVKGCNSDDGQMDQTQSESMSKTKCGSCGIIGHNRKWEKCPNYYSLEECRRRQVNADKARERIEARERAEEEVKNNLEEHHQQLSNIAAIIEAEQKRVDGTIKQFDKKKKQRENQRSRRGR